MTAVPATAGAASPRTARALGDRPCPSAAAARGGPPDAPPRLISRLVAEELRHPEGQVEGLAGVQPGVAGGEVSLVELGVEDFLSTAEALGDVLARQLDVEAAGPYVL